MERNSHLIHNVNITSIITCHRFPSHPPFPPPPPPYQTIEFSIFTGAMVGIDFLSYFLGIPWKVEKAFLPPNAVLTPFVPVSLAEVGSTFAPFDDRQQHFRRQMPFPPPLSRRHSDVAVVVCGAGSFNSGSVRFGNVRSGSGSARVGSDCTGSVLIGRGKRLILDDGRFIFSAAAAAAALKLALQRGFADGFTGKRDEADRRRRRRRGRRRG